MGGVQERRTSKSHNGGQKAPEPKKDALNAPCLLASKTATSRLRNLFEAPKEKTGPHPGEKKQVRVGGYLNPRPAKHDSIYANNKKEKKKRERERLSARGGAKKAEKKTKKK